MKNLKNIKVKFKKKNLSLNFLIRKKKKLKF